MIDISQFVDELDRPINGLRSIRADHRFLTSQLLSADYLQKRLACLLNERRKLEAERS